MSSEEIVKFVNVKKTFGSYQILKNLTFSIKRNKITFIIGRSGEGKSVTIKHIIGLLKPDSGDIYFDNQKMINVSEELWMQERKKMGLLFQDGALFDSMTIYDNVSFPIIEFNKLSSKEILEQAKYFLSLVGLDNIKNKYPSELSIGEKKRVGLARALAMKPILLMYDEPTTSMDPIISELIDKLIIDTQKQVKGMSSIVISHDVKSMLTVADEIILLHDGIAYLSGTVDEFKNSTDPIIKQFLQGDAEGPLTLNMQ